MTEQLQADPVEALEALEALGSWLSQLRGRPLDPTRPSDRLRGLGRLAHWYAQQAPGPSAGSLQGSVDSLPDEPRRAVAALLWQWGVAALRDDPTRAADWLEVAVRTLVAHPGCPEGLEAHLLDELLVEALSAVHDGAADPAVAAWTLIARREGRGEARRAALCARAVSREEGVALAGMERGILGGEVLALERLVRFIAVEPDDEGLQFAVLRLASHAGLDHHARGRSVALREVVEAVGPTLVWAQTKAPASLGQSQRDHVAELSICVAAATEAPWEAVAALRAALRFRPDHPTAGRLLAVALAALAARRLGHGRGDEARAAAREAAGLFRRLDFAPPDLAGWERLVLALEARDEPV